MVAPFPEGYPHYGVTGGSVGLRVLPKALFPKHLLPIGGILRFRANYKISTLYAPLHAKLEAIITNES